MRLSREEVMHIALLARLGLTEEEVERASQQLSNILEHFEVLQEMDTGEVPPTAQSIVLNNVLREDEACDSFPQEQMLSNAPQEDEESFRVNAILE